MPDVEVTLGAQDADLVRAWQRSKQGPKEFAQELDRVQRKSRDVDNSLATVAKNLVTRYGSAAAAIALVTKEFRDLAAARSAVRGEEGQTTAELDAVFRRFQLQARMTDAQGARARTQIFETAKAEAFPVEQTAEVGRQLVSSGFTPKEVLEQGGMQEVVAGMKASAVKGEEVDARQLVESITQFILAQREDADKALTRENLARVIRGTQALFLSRNIQFSDLGELAKAAPALSGARVSTEDQLAYYTMVRDILNPEEAATGLRNVAQRISTIKEHPEKVKALGRIGLNPEDLDLEGEDFEEALRRLQAGLAKVGESDRAGILVKLFEERGRATADYLLGNIDKLAVYREEESQGEAFEQAHATATTGFAAEQQRREIEKQRQRFGGGGAVDEAIAQEIELANPDNPARARLEAERYRTARSYGVPRELIPGAAERERELEAQGAVPERENPQTPERQRALRQIPLPELGAELTPQEWERTERAARLARDVAYREADFASSGTVGRDERVPFGFRPTQHAQGFSDYVRALILRGEESVEISQERLEELLTERLFELEGVGAEGKLGPRLSKFRRRIARERGEEDPAVRRIDETLQIRRGEAEAEIAPFRQGNPSTPANPAGAPAAPRSKEPFPPAAARPAAGDSAALGRAIERQNRLLEEIAANTRDPHVTLRNPGDPMRLAGRARSRPAIDRRMEG